MCPADSGGGSVGPIGQPDVAAALLARISGGDLPAGAELEPAALSSIFGCSHADIEAALCHLETVGATERLEGTWRVSLTRQGEARDLMHWAAPILRAVVGLAVTRITPADAAAVLAAYDRFAGLSGDGSAATRTLGYAQMMRRLADASGSSFHVRAVDRLLEEAAPLVAKMVAHQMAFRKRPEPDDELGRVARAMMQSNPANASAALEDHLLLLARYADHSLPTG
jgi:DNA-binding GntR family transcriptional regulator